MTTNIARIITSFVTHHCLTDTPMVAVDTGMLSATNLRALDELALSFVEGLPRNQ